MRNPFSLIFGKRPIQTIERIIQKNIILDSFSSEEQQVYIITGIRGSGKTVLMTEVAEELKESEEWIVIELNPTVDMLQSLAAKLCSNRGCAEIFRAARLNLSLLGLGIEISGEPPISDAETAISRMLESLKKEGKKVFVAVDEVSSTPNIHVFVSAFQIFVRQGLPIYLLMTGLYENIDELQNEKNLTFLYRAPKVPLKPLNLVAIANRYRAILGKTAEEADYMAKLTKGYPFAFQVLGYLSWANRDMSTEDLIPEYEQYLGEYVYEKIWSELSAKDKEVAYAIATTKSPKILDIREKLGMTTNEFNPYRNRLIKKGVLNGDERGMVYFSLPLFDSFVTSNYYG